MINKKELKKSAFYALILIILILVIWIMRVTHFFYKDTGAIYVILIIFLFLAPIACLIKVIYHLIKAFCFPKKMEDIYTENKEADNKLTKNNFILGYIELPPKSTMRYMIGVSLLLVNVFNYMVYYHTARNVPRYDAYDIVSSILLVAVVLIDVWGIILFIFIKKLSRQFHLFTATAFMGSSVFYLLEACQFTLFDFRSEAIILIAIYIVFYILVLLGVIQNIRKKISKGQSVLVNNKGTFAISCLGGTIGISLAKLTNTSLTYFLDIVSLLGLSYIFLLTCSGFHKYHLRKKLSKELTLINQPKAF